MSTEKLAAQMEQIILNRIAQDKLTAATLPQTAEKVLQVLRDPNFSTKRVVALIEKDPLLAVRVLRVANSAVYGGGGNLARLDAAVSRLGTQKLRTLLIDLSARQVFISKDTRIARASAAIWEHSLAVALIARDLTALSNGGDADGTYLCGLLHDIGKPLVAVMLLEAEKILAQEQGNAWIGSEAWVTVVNKTHRKVGVALAEKWQLPADVVSGIAESGDYDNAARKSPANYVRFSNALAKREGFVVGPIDADEVSALIMIGRSLLDLDDEIIGKLTVSLKERVSGAMAS
jgi:putative nucleotidyltransferase with HDIG domain